MKKPLKIQVLVETRPMEAEGFAPRCPTMAVSTYCRMEDRSCWTIAGSASCTSAVSIAFLLLSADSVVVFRIFSDTAPAQIFPAQIIIIVT